MQIKKIFEKFSLSKVFDFVIINFSIFILLFSWIRFVTKSIYLATIISSLLILGYNMTKFYIDKSKRNKNALSDRKKKEIEDKVFSLISFSSSELNEILAQHYLAQNTDNGWINNLFITKDDHLTGIGFYFDNTLLSLEYAIKIIRKSLLLRLKKIIILCYDCKEDVENKLSSIENISVEIFRKEKVYEELFEDKGIEINNEITFSKTRKLKLRDYFKYALTKEKSNKYFFSGLLIFFASLIVRNNLYYIIMSSFLFCMALLSRKNFSLNK